MIEERRRKPRSGDDLLNVLLDADLDGVPLGAEQLLEYCEVLVEAGNETTRNAISGGVLAFCEHPGTWEQLRAHPELMPDAVEEILRWVSPITHFARVATEDSEMHGMTIHAGDPVALYFASANRDEDVFDDPFAFRLDRRPNPHLAFGFGEHFCMGAHLARVSSSTSCCASCSPASIRSSWRARSNACGRRSTAVSNICRFATAWPSDVAGAEKGHVMEYRPFGQTELQVSAVGFGCREVGGGYGEVDATFSRHGVDLRPDSWIEGV